MLAVLIVSYLVTSENYR